MTEDQKDSQFDAELSEEVFDALLRRALIEDLQREMDELEKDESLHQPYPFSKRFQRRMDRFFRKEVYHKPNPALLVLRKVAVFAVCLLAAGFIAMISIPSVRASIRTLFIQTYDDHITFSRTNPNAVSTPAEPYAVFDGYEVQYLPEGYEVVEWNPEKDKCTGRFFNPIEDNGEIKFYAYEADLWFGPPSADSEHSKLTDQDVNGHEGYRFEAIDDEGVNKIMWLDENYCFEVFSLINIDELLKIAENITPIQ